MTSYLRNNNYRGSIFSNGWLVVLLVVVVVVLTSKVKAEYIPTPEPAITSFADVSANFAYRKDVDVFYLLIAAYMVFFMQVGFSMVEAGTVRASNVINLLLKNSIDMSMGTLTYWACGFGLGFGVYNNAGVNPVFGNTHFFLIGGEHGTFSNFLFQWVFNATTMAIISGSIAERGTILGYMIQAIVFNIIIYPPITHWMWSNSGWLSPFNVAYSKWRVGYMGAIDWAGCSCIHMVGGLVGLVGTVAMKPRFGRFLKNGEVTFFRPHNQTLIMMGTWILYFSWFSFNAGSSLVITKISSVVEITAVNSCIASSAAAATGLIVGRILDGKYILTRVLNAFLAGLVGITTGCSTVEGWAALIIGIISTLAFFGVSSLYTKLGIDDPLDASPLHFGVGVWGLLSAGIFSSPRNIANAYGFADVEDVRAYGFIYGDTGVLFGIQILACLACIAWVSFWSALMYLGIRYTVQLRVSEDDEEAGIDIVHHNGPAYDIVEFEKTLAMKKGDRGKKAAPTNAFVD